MGVAVLVGVAFLSWTSFSIVGVVCYRVKSVQTFEDIAHFSGMPRTTIKIMLGCYTGFSCVSFILLACDFVAGENGLSQYQWACTESDSCAWLISPFRHRWVVTVFLTLFVLFPFSRFKDFTSLKRVSHLSALSMIFMMGVALNSFFHRDAIQSTFEASELTDQRYRTHPPTEHQEPSEVYSINRGFFLANPIYVVAYTAQYNAPRLYSELKHASPRRFSIASGLAIFYATAIYGFFGVMSYETFGENTAPDVLENYPSDSTTAALSRLALSVVVLTTYPLAFHTLRESVQPLCLGISPEKLDILLILSTAVWAVFLTDISLLLDYKGALLGGVISFMLPAIAFLNTNPVKAEDLAEEAVEEGTQLIEEESPSDPKVRFVKYWSIFLIVWALFSSIGGVVETTHRLLQDLHQE